MTAAGIERLGGPRVTAPGLVVERLEARDGWERLEAAWGELARAVDRPSCFATPSYLRAWRATLAGDVDPLLLAVRGPDGLVGVMPAMRARVRRGPQGAPRHDFAPSDRELLGPGRPRPFALRQLSPVVSMPAALVGPAPLCRDRDRERVIDALSGALAGLGGWDVLALPVDQEREQDPWCAALRRRGLAPWVLSLGRRIGGIGRVEPFATRVARSSANFRRSVRRAGAAAAAAGLAFEIHEGRGAVAARMPDVAAVAAASWKDRGRDGVELTVPYAGRQRRFLEALIGDPASERELVPVLAVARLGGEPVVATLSLLHGDRLTGVVTFRAEVASGLSPGLLTLGRVIDWAADRGLGAFDLNATQEWTRHLVDEVRTQNVVVCFSRGLRGRAMGAVSALARRRG